MTRKLRLDSREADLDRRDPGDHRRPSRGPERAARGRESLHTAEQAEVACMCELVTKIEHMPPEVETWFDRRTVGDGRTMRDLFNANMARSRAARGGAGSHRRGCPAADPWPEFLRWSRLANVDR